MTLTNPTLQTAFRLIREANLTHIRCSLTGAPYAEIDSDEIVLALEGDIAADPEVTTNRLVDLWELRLLTLSSQPAPFLRGVNSKSLLPLLSRGHTGNVRVLAYLTTRLFFPHIGSEPLPSELARERMLYAAEAYDSFSKLPVPEIAGLVQQLVAVDSYCAMPYWHKLWIFESRFSKLGIETADATVRKAFVEPSRVAADIKVLHSVVTFLFNLMLYASENDSVAGRSGNRMAQQLLMLEAEGPFATIPRHQKVMAQADIDRMARARAVNSRQELRIAWSATRGSGYLPGELAAFKAKAKPKVDSKSKTKAKTTIDIKFASAFFAAVDAFKKD